MTLTKVTDQAVNIDSAVGEFMVKFFVALLVVMLVCFLSMGWRVGVVVAAAVPLTLAIVFRSEEHTSELQSLMRISYAVFCLKKKNYKSSHKATSSTKVQ